MKVWHDPPSVPGFFQRRELLKPECQPRVAERLEVIEAAATRSEV